MQSSNRDFSSSNKSLHWGLPGTAETRRLEFQSKTRKMKETEDSTVPASDEDKPAGSFL